MRVAAYHLPSTISGFDVEARSADEITLELVVATPSLLSKVVNHVDKARQRIIKRNAREIAQIFKGVCLQWRESTDPFRRLAEEALPSVTRFSPAMVACGLDLVLQGYTEEAFDGLLRESGAEEVLEGFVSLGPHLGRAYGPALTTHVLAGNIPGVGLPGMILATMLGSASLVKTASSDPLFPALWAASVAHRDPEVGDALAVLWWSGGREDLETVAFDRADVVVAYGSDQTIHELQGRVRGRFLGHGHRVSFGLVGREVLSKAAEVAEQAAYDASLFDQQGCLSPHLFYVEEGGHATPREFAGLLASAMERWAKRLPPGSPAPEEAISIRRFRATYEARELAGKEITLLISPQGLEWTVVYEADPSFAPSCLHRTVLVKPVADLSEVGGLLGPWRMYLQAAGVAAAAERIAMVAGLLGQAGVSRICPIGKMQVPPLTWHQEGRNLMHDLLRWVDLET